MFVGVYYIWRLSGPDISGPEQYFFITLLCHQMQLLVI